MLLPQALRYPFAGKGWFKPVLILALVQLIPVVGQLILFGYGQQVARMVYNGQTELPPIHWRQALLNGLLFVIAGMLYLVPLLGVVPTAVTIAIVTIGVGKDGTLNPLGLLLVGLLSLAIFVIITGLHVSGVRFAVEGKGLFNPNGTVRLLLKNRAATVRLFLNIIALSLITVVTTALGLLLLIIPGLLMFVSGLLALWYLLARYALEIGIGQPTDTPEKQFQPLRGLLRNLFQKRT